MVLKRFSYLYYSEVSNQMTKVYILIDDSEIVGVFSTMRKAKLHGKEIYPMIIDDIPEYESESETEEEEESDEEEEEESEDED